MAVETKDTTRWQNEGREIKNEQESQQRIHVIFVCLPSIVYVFICDETRSLCK